MLTLLTSSESLFHYKKLTADVAAGTSLAVINDNSTLVLNLVVIIGRIVLDVIQRRAERRAKKRLEKQNEI
jgi:nitrogen fixation/metabolism regulation signal transduction histidine kinase